MDFKPPGPLSLEGNVSENWKLFKQQFTNFLIAKESDKKADSIRIAQLLTCVGHEALERYNQFEFAEGEDNTKFDDVIKKFDKNFDTLKRTVFCRYTFWTNQRNGKIFQDYLSTLRTLAAPCEFTERDEMIRDKIVFSTQNAHLKEKLLSQETLTLQKTIDICEAFETTQNALKTMKNGEGTDKMAHPDKTVEVDTIKSKKGQKKSEKSSHHSSQPEQQEGNPKRFSKYKRTYKCQRCGETHQRKQCPAYEKTCMKCNGRNHYTAMCKSTMKNVRAVDCYDYSDTDDEFYIGAVMMCNVGKSVDAWYVNVRVAGSLIKMKVDTGAETNAIPAKTWFKIQGRPELQKTRTTLKSFDGSTVQHLGSATVQLSVNEKTCNAEMFVTSLKTVPVIGLRSCLKLGIVQPGENLPNKLTVASTHITNPISLANVEHEYADIFQGLGKYPGKYHVTLKADAKPVIHAPRRVAPYLLQPLKKKLDEMVDQHVVVPIQQPTDWVNSLVIVEKPDKSLRLCLDPKDLNKSIKREFFQIPRFEDVLTQLAGATFFTILDQKDSYWQVELDDDSIQLTTFNTPFGRYAFRRLPFGIACASDALQLFAQKVFGDIQGVHLIADDMLIAAKSEEEHDDILTKVLQRAREHGVKFNKKKIQFKCKEVTYMGRILGVNGVRPDPKKIRAILEMPTPSDKPALQRLLGLVNFLSPFIPNMSEVTSPLRALLKKGTIFMWLPEHEKAMTKLHSILSAEPVLQMYDESKPLTIQCDASIHGLGACALQKGRPICYASRALTDAETRYSNIEREMLAILFATQAFHQYIYGRKSVKVQSDHKPLEAIFLKPLHKASPRLQMMMMKMMKYSLEVRYTPGSHMYIADTLSRAHLQDKSCYPEIHRIHAVTPTVPASEQMLKEIRHKTQEDPVLQEVKNLIHKGWPKYKANVRPQLKAYWPHRDMIHEEDDILFLSDRIIVPYLLRNSMLQRIHEGHLGISKCTARAKQVLYWPNMDKDVEQMVTKCTTCATYKCLSQGPRFRKGTRPTFLECLRSWRPDLAQGISAGT